MSSRSPEYFLFSRINYDKFGRAEERFFILNRDLPSNKDKGFFWILIGTFHSYKDAEKEKMRLEVIQKLKMNHES